MKKKYVLLSLIGLCFFALNFVSREKAEELSAYGVPEELGEQFYREYLYPCFPASSQTDRVRAFSENFYKSAHSLAVTRNLERMPRERVLATIYKPTYPMTDVTASGKKIDTLNASAHRWIAVSRDLQAKGFSFGTRVLISGTGTHDGIWEVQDVMNRRWKSRIDFLSDLDAPQDLWKNVMITKLN